MKRVVGIGETVLDILFKNDQPMKAVPGGSTFNSIVSLGRAGVDCAMVTEVGGDHVGDIICNFLVDNGVSAEYVCRHEKNKSHVTLAFLDENNDAFEMAQRWSQDVCQQIGNNISDELVARLNAQP